MRAADATATGLTVEEGIGGILQCDGAELFIAAIAAYEEGSARITY